MNAHPHSHSPTSGTGRPRRNSLASALAGLGLSIATLAASAATVTTLTDHDAYYPGESISVTFTDGPGNPKDWIGVYPPDATPGGPASTLWNYVDNTRAGATGLKEGVVTFPNGLALAGDWLAYFFVNDSYTQLTTNTFKVVDPGTPLVRPSQRIYAIGQSITVTFSAGPAAAKDWVGIYKEGQTPGGGVNSTLWAYVDGTQAGNAGLADGTITFASGLAEAGSYVAHFLANDGYDILASERFAVLAPTGSGPRLLSSTPSDGSSNQPPLLRFTASITNGTTAIRPGTLVLKLDGTAVVPTLQQSDGLLVVSHTNATLPAAGSTHVWSLSVSDTGVPANELKAEVRTTIGQYTNIQLPAPLHFENFDAVAEGSLPAGWTGVSYTEVANPEEDLGNLDSASYSRWTVVAAQRFEGSFVTYSNPDNPDGWETDYRRVLTPNPFNVLNGSVLQTPLASGRFLFGDSGYRNGRSQVLWVSTPDYDLTGKTNIHLSFKSLWEQNQDSIAMIEYSIDQGATWLPVAYFIDRNDLVTTTPDGGGDPILNVEATLTTERGDIARFADDLGNELGGMYGAFVAAPISQDLAPFIHGRIDDHTSDSKRIELFPLPQAANRSKVRVRFGHAGTDSWYFGLDDVGIYSIGSTPEPAPTLTITRGTTSVTLGWAAGLSGVVLESSPTLAPATWTPVQGVSGNSHSLPASAPAAFYRLRR